jgi:hypothetical protein
MYRLRSRALCEFELLCGPQLAPGLGLYSFPELAYAPATNVEEGHVRTQYPLTGPSTRTPKGVPQLRRSSPWSPVTSNVREHQ